MYKTYLYALTDGLHEFALRIMTVADANYFNADVAPGFVWKKIS